MSLSQFLRAHCILNPNARTKLREFADAFRSDLSEANREAYTRSRLIYELAKVGLSLGADSSGTTWIVGVALKHPAPWTVEDGQVRPVAHA